MGHSNVGYPIREHCRRCCRRLSILIFRKCFQDWHAAIPEYYTEAREDDHSIMAKQREDLKVIEDGLG